MGYDFGELLLNYGWVFLVLLAAIGGLFYFDILDENKISTFEFEDGTIDTCKELCTTHSGCKYYDCDSGYEYHNQVNVRVMKDE